MKSPETGRSREKRRKAPAKPPSNAETNPSRTPRRAHPAVGPDLPGKCHRPGHRPERAPRGQESQRAKEWREEAERVRSFVFRLPRSVSARACLLAAEAILRLG